MVHSSTRGDLEYRPKARFFRRGVDLRSLLESLGKRKMLQSTLYSASWYALSAVVFFAFTVLFIRRFGPAPYGEFSILLNSLSALTLLGNYHSYLVSYSITTDRHAFMQYFVRAALPFAAIMTPAVALTFALVTGLRVGLAVLTAGIFALLLLAGMPTAVVIATPENWRFNCYRAVYQISLVVAFSLFFEACRDAQLSFLLAALIAAAVFVASLWRRASRELRPAGSGPEPPPRILLMSVIGNISLAMTMLADKFALTYLSVGSDRQLAGVYMLYNDVLSRGSAIFLIMFCPVTYALLDRRGRGQPVQPLLVRLALGTVALGGVCLVVGYVAMPLIYGNIANKAPLLPLFISTIATGQGLGSIVGAYFGTTGRGRLLMQVNGAIFAAAVTGIAVFQWRCGRGFSVTQLAFVLAVGYAINGVALVRGLYFDEDRNSSRRRRSG
jgi:hypothetical protein